MGPPPRLYLNLFLSLLLPLILNLWATVGGVWGVCLPSVGGNFSK